MIYFGNPSLNQLKLLEYEDLSKATAVIFVVDIKSVHILKSEFIWAFNLP